MSTGRSCLLLLEGDALGAFQRDEFRGLEAVEVGHSEAREAADEEEVSGQGQARRMAAQIQGFHLLQFVHGEPDGRAVLSNLLEALPAVGGVDIVPLLLHGGQDALDPLDVAADVVLAQRLPIEPALLALGDEIVVPIHVHLIEGGESIRTCRICRRVTA